jgi:hypothetical protein
MRRSRPPVYRHLSEFAPKLTLDLQMNNARCNPLKCIHKRDRSMRSAIPTSVVCSAIAASVLLLGTIALLRLAPSAHGEEEVPATARWPAADRDLTLRELDELLHLSDFAIDKRNDWLDRNPALTAIVRDETDRDPGVRQRAVVALSRIRDKRVIEVLIETLLDKDRDVADQANEQLAKIVHGDPVPEPLPPDWDSPERRQYYQRWRDFWREHGKDFQLERPPFMGAR